MSVILGISETHCATACVTKDGNIIACASEERFTRRKNQDGFPERAVEWVLSKVNEPIDLVVLSFKNFYWYPHLEFSEELPFWRRVYRNLGGYISYKSPKLEFLTRIPEKLIFPLFKHKWNNAHMKYVQKKLNIKKKKKYYQFCIKILIL
ncbi:MAG: carbamoyltransferase N-terminal domain-containing protein [Candidatus Aenigmatarchaeota archaeon]